MARKSRRELERALEGIGGAAVPADPTPIVFEDPETGAWYDNDALAGDPVTPAAVDPVVIIEIPKADRREDA